MTGSYCCCLCETAFLFKIFGADLLRSFGAFGSEVVGERGGLIVTELIIMSSRKRFGVELDVDEAASAGLLNF